MGGKVSLTREEEEALKSSPNAFMMEKHGERAVAQIRLWTEFGFPLKGSFSVPGLERVFEALNKDKKKKAQVDWLAFKWWQDEAAARLAKQKRMSREGLTKSGMEGLSLSSTDPVSMSPPLGLLGARPPPPPATPPPPAWSPRGTEPDTWPAPPAPIADDVHPSSPTAPPPPPPSAAPLGNVYRELLTELKDYKARNRATSSPVLPESSGKPEHSSTTAQTHTTRRKTRKGGADQTPASILHAHMARRRRSLNNDCDSDMDSDCMSDHEDDDEWEEEYASPGKTRSGKMYLKPRAEGERFVRTQSKRVGGVYPMLEAPNAHGGKDMVLRPYSVAEIVDMASTLPDPEKAGGARLASELLQWARESAPTAWEIKKVLWKVLKPGQKRDRLLRVFPDTECVKRHQVHEHSANEPWRRLLQNLSEAITELWPLRMDWSAISNCVQAPTEGVEDYVTRLRERVEMHSGLEPESPTFQEVLKNAFLSHMRRELSEAIKTKCVEWNVLSLDALVMHAKHAEWLEQKVKDESESRARLMMMEALAAKGGNNTNGNGGGKKWTGRRGGQKRTPQNSPCAICKQLGHWARECPQNADKGTGGQGRRRGGTERAQQTSD